MARYRWVDSRADRLLARLRHHSVFIEADAAAAIINERVDQVAAVLQIGQAAARRYLDDVTIDDLADRLVEMIADERPGANLLAEPRDVLIDPHVLGRTIAGLAEAVGVQLPGGDGGDHVHALAQHISLLGQMLADAPPVWIPVPGALIARVASQLERVAGLPGVSPAELVEAFRRDAQRLRDLVSEPTPATVLDARAKFGAVSTRDNHDVPGDFDDELAEITATVGSRAESIIAAGESIAAAVRAEADQLAGEAITNGNRAQHPTLGSLPPQTFNQSQAWRYQFAEAADALAADTRRWGAPIPRCTGEEMALHLILHRAAATAGEDSQPLDAGWDDLFTVLFQDHDVLTLYDVLDSDFSDLGVVNLSVEQWFSEFSLPFRVPHR